MSSGFFGSQGSGSSPFDDFIARIFGAGAGSPSPGYRVDITRLMSGPARELIGAAAAKAAERGTDLDTEQMLWAAATLEPTRQLLARSGADPGALARAAEGQPGQLASRAGEPPQLTPGAKRALLDAHQISRSLGSTYIGPEHILLALAVNAETPAGQGLSAARVTPESLQASLTGQGLPPGDGRTSTPTLDEFGRDGWSWVLRNTNPPCRGYLSRRDKRLRAARGTMRRSSSAQCRTPLNHLSKDGPVRIGGGVDLGPWD